MTTTLLLHAASTVGMTGLIWFVQVVHYPLFRLAGERHFQEFAVAHQRRTAWVVVPLMVTELVTALLLTFRGPTESEASAILGLSLLTAIWLSTFLIQVPLHRRLAQGFDSDAARMLVSSNWFRTIAWSARSIIALRLLAA